MDGPRVLELSGGGGHDLFSFSLLSRLDKNFIWHGVGATGKAAYLHRASQLQVWQKAPVLSPPLLQLQPVIALFLRYSKPG